MKRMRNRYLEKQAFCPPQLTRPPNPDTGIIVVIPCHDEPDFLQTLDSLFECQRPQCAVEILVVVNESARTPDKIKLQNQRTYEDIQEWIQTHANPDFQVHAIHVKAMPKKHAGVGLARKIGMDEAVARFESIGQKKGIIVQLDADCTCASNYLVSIETQYQKTPETTGGTLYFEHPLDDLSGEHRLAMAQYELYLRYYVNALRYADFPYAFHTIGSCITVRSDIYQKVGGMNKRKAGEDFYFLQKVIQTWHCAKIKATCVYPSPRFSDRVPFGTGKAVEERIEAPEQKSQAYHPLIFRDLKPLMASVPTLFSMGDLALGDFRQTLPEAVSGFLKEQDFVDRILELQANTTSVQAFVKGFFRWFNAFVAMKYVHYARDHHYPSQPIEQVARWLLEQVYQDQVTLLSGEKDICEAERLLMAFRTLDKQTQPVPLPQ